MYINNIIAVALPPKVRRTATDHRHARTHAPAAREGEREILSERAIGRVKLRNSSA